MLKVLYVYTSTSEVCAMPNMAVFLGRWFRVSLYVAQVLSEWFWNGSIFPYYYWYRFCLYIPHALYLRCKFFIF